MTAPSGQFRMDKYSQTHRAGRRIYSFRGYQTPCADFATHICTIVKITGSSAMNLQKYVSFASLPLSYPHIRQKPDAAKKESQAIHAWVLGRSLGHNHAIRPITGWVCENRRTTEAVLTHLGVSGPHAMILHRIDSDYLF